MAKFGPIILRRLLTRGSACSEFGHARWVAACACRGIHRSGTASDDSYGEDIGQLRGLVEGRRGCDALRVETGWKKLRVRTPHAFSSIGCPLLARARVSRGRPRGVPGVRGRGGGRQRDAYEATAVRELSFFSILYTPKNDETNVRKKRCLRRGRHGTHEKQCGTPPTADVADGLRPLSTTY